VSRTLGLDPGSRRIGVALSDLTGTIASPHTVIDRSGEDVAAKLRELCRESEVERIVVGLPLHLSGREGPAVEAAREIADLARKATGLPVDMHDERFTTVTAESALLEAGVRRRKRREVRDMVAATVLLQSYLDSRSGDDRTPGDGN
jgi:putative Holliday junction resolvase